MRKGFSLIEVSLVISVIAILAMVAMPMYADYTKKSRTVEIPGLLKTIVQFQGAWQATPESGGNYATALETIRWVTNRESVSGKYYHFGTSGVSDCDPAGPVGLAEAWAIEPDSVLDNWANACMDFEANLMTAPL